MAVYDIADMARPENQVGMKFFKCGNSVDVHRVETDRAKYIVLIEREKDSNRVVLRHAFNLEDVDGIISLLKQAKEKSLDQASPQQVPNS